MSARSRDLSETTVIPTLLDWIKVEALPFWATHGWDKQRGGFHEKLALDATPILTAPRRVRVQARQIYVYAHAYQLGWYPEGLQKALDGFHDLIRKAHRVDGHPGFVHLLSADAEVLDARRDSYDHMFILLASTWLARASGDGQIRAFVDELLSFIDDELTDPFGYLLEGVPAQLPRRQNPNMHGFEAMIALTETIQHPEGLARASRFLRLFDTKIYDRQNCYLREFLDDNWQALPPPIGTSIEPGHAVEWTWLLRRYESQLGIAPSSVPSALLDAALNTKNPLTGLLFDEVDISGIPRKRTSRTWPQAELVKAWLCETELGRAGAQSAAIKALGKLKQFYLDPAPPACWVDQVDETGRVISDHIPASTFYHLFLAIAEADRILPPTLT